MEKTVTDTALQYGVLGVVALVFAVAIIYLFKAMRADHKEMDAERKGIEAERKQWAVERVEIRNEFERKHRELVESCAEAAQEERNENRAHEDLVRKEFAELMEQVAAESGQSSQAIVDMMQKFLDRFVGRPR